MTICIEVNHESTIAVPDEVQKQFEKIEHRTQGSVMLCAVWHDDVLVGHMVITEQLEGLFCYPFFCKTVTVGEMFEVLQAVGLHFDPRTVKSLRVTFTSLHGRHYYMLRSHLGQAGFVETGGGVLSDVETVGGGYLRRLVIEDDTILTVTFFRPSLVQQAVDDRLAKRKRRFASLDLVGFMGLLIQHMISDWRDDWKARKTKY